MKFKLTLLTPLAFMLVACGSSEPDDAAYEAIVEIVEATKARFDREGDLKMYDDAEIVRKGLISPELIIGDDVMLPVYGGLRIYDLSDKTYRLSIGSVSKDACIYMTKVFADSLKEHGLETIEANSKILWRGGKESEELEARCVGDYERAEYFRFDFNVAG